MNLIPGQHYPTQLVPRSGPQINSERIRRMYRTWGERLAPHDKQDSDDADDLKMKGLAAVFGSLQLISLLPWYCSSRDDKKYIAVWKAHYYLPHWIISSFLYPPVGAVFASYISISLALRIGILGPMEMLRLIDGWFGTTFFRQAQQNMQEHVIEQQRQNNDPSDVPDDKFLVPDTEMIDFDAPEPVAWLGKNESTLVFGKSQRGKTSGIKTLAAQLDYRTDTAVIAHGSRDDYTRYFEDELGLETISISKFDSDVVWNMFGEVPPDATPGQAEEIFDKTVETLLPSRGLENNHFSENARNIVVACCMILWEKRDDPDHADLYNLLLGDVDKDKYDNLGDKIKTLLEKNGYPDVAQSIRPGEKGDTFQTVTRQIRKNMKGSFKESGDFSFREYFENPRGRVVSVETGEELKRGAEMFASMLDRANAQALDDYSGTTSYFIYDELSKLGPIENLSDLASRGLKQGVRVIIGVQTMHQFKVVYDKKGPGSETLGIANNFGQSISYQAGKETADWIQGELGEETQITESVSRGSGAELSRTQSETQRFPIDSSTITGLDKGTSVVLGPEGQWWVVDWLHPDKAVPRMKQERGSFPARSPSASADRSPGTEGTDQTATAGADADLWDGDTGRRD